MPAASVQGHARIGSRGPSPRDDDRPERKTRNGCLDRLAIGAPPAPDHSRPSRHGSGDPQERRCRSPGAAEGDQRFLGVPSRGRQIVDQDHRGARLGDAPKRRQLGELLRVADAGARPIGEHLEEWETERRGDRLGDLLAEAIRPPRVAAGDARDRLGGSIAAELVDEAGLIDRLRPRANGSNRPFAAVHAAPEDRRVH